LPQGEYELHATTRVLGVNSLSFGKNHGATLHVAGKPQRSKALLSDTGWEKLQTAFQVNSPGEEVVLICELRASAGQVFFQSDSLVLVKKVVAEELAAARTFSSFYATKPD
jgi:hypothetical protein